MKKTMVIRIIYLCLLGIFILSSCEKEDLAPVKTQSQFEIDMAKLEKLGFNTEVIDEYEDYYVVECDMKVSKDLLTDIELDSEIPDKHLKQAHIGSQYFISFANRYVYVFLDDNFTTVDLEDELDDVIAAYNSIGSYLKFSTVGAAYEADIIITQSNLPAGVCAAASFPINGLAGPEIEVDQSEIGDDHEENTYLLAHEIGHCLGLRHTDWNVWRSYCMFPLESQTGPHTEDASQTVTAVTISGTDNSDANSVFNKCRCGEEWNGFSTNDRIALRAMYPALSAGIYGPTKCPCYSSHTWTVNAYNGTGSYTYAWTWKKYNSTHVLIAQGTSSSKSITQSLGDTQFLEMKCVVRSGSETVTTVREAFSICGPE